ncbi:hypothetical protein SDC9_203481 [bioreactor metagenome]|uniref:Uncharacterized protein n=1 Tax=bioreactor metagenome TaxID=1076179 RepID=A0A645IXD3_9ZZZZ
MDKNQNNNQKNQNQKNQKSSSGMNRTEFSEEYSITTNGVNSGDENVKVQKNNKNNKNNCR